MYNLLFWVELKVPIPVDSTNLGGIRACRELEQHYGVIWRGSRRIWAAGKHKTQDVDEKSKAPSNGSWRIKVSRRSVKAIEEERVFPRIMRRVDLKIVQTPHSELEEVCMAMTGKLLKECKGPL